MRSYDELMMNINDTIGLTFLVLSLEGDVISTSNSNAKNYASLLAAIKLQLQYLAQVSRGCAHAGTYILS